MFPNVRLLIGTLVITILVLSCEFGVFAAMRVNREPLSRLTTESAPLQLVAGKNAPPGLPVAWRTPLNVQTPAGNAQTGAAIAEAAQPAERVIDAAASPNDGVAGTLIDQASPAVLQTALAPSPATPVPAAGPPADAVAPIVETPPPPAHSPASANEATPTNADASGAPAQEVTASAIRATIGNGPPEQIAAAPPALAAVPAPQMPAAEIVRAAEAEPPQAAPAAQAHETATQANEPAAGGAPVVVAIARAAAEPAAQPGEITASMPNAAMPEPAAAKIEQAHAKPSPKVVHKPPAKKPHKAAHAPAQAHHVVKKRLARRGRAPAASSAQPANAFANPVFQSAPEFQRQARTRAGAKNTATNNGFNTTFGAQFGTQ